MPELKRCAYCTQPINEEEGYVEVEPAAQDSNHFGEPIYTQYAHVKCAEQMASLEKD
jgi:hypothetical protein